MHTLKLLRRTARVVHWIFTCAILLGCGARDSQPTARELFDLRAKCAAYGEQVPGYDRIISHYNQQTTKCYLERVWFGGDGTDVLDAQSRKPLLDITELKAENLYKGTVISSDGTVINSYTAAKAKLKELMQEDAY